VSSSDDDLKITGSKKANAQHENESSDNDEEEKKEVAPVKKAPTKMNSTGEIREIANTRKTGKNEIEVDFQYVVPSPAYYHSVKALLNQYVDGDEGDEMDYMGMADLICERASIGQCVVSPLDPEKDPE